MALVGIVTLALPQSATSAPPPDARQGNAHLPTLTVAEFPELAWLAAGTDTADFLSRLPAPCRADGRGRILFESSALFGGTAARFGLSCASCHRGGRSNADFFIAGISDGPGTADVTDALFGPGRANGVADARPIPDLATPTGLRFADRRDPAFRAFVHQLVVDEFGGAAPPEAAMDDLIVYLAAISPRCIGSDAPITVNRDLDLALSGVDAARWHLGRGDSATAALYLRAARRQLDLIDRRFAPPAPAIAGQVRPMLRQTAHALAKAQQDLADISATAANNDHFQDLTAIDARVAKAAMALRAGTAQLERVAQDSLYAHDVLEQALHAQ